MEASFILHSCGYNYAQASVNGTTAAYFKPCDEDPLVLPTEKPALATNIALGCIDGQELFWNLLREYHPILLGLPRHLHMQGMFWVYQTEVMPEDWQMVLTALKAASGHVPSLNVLSRAGILPIPEEVTYDQIVQALTAGFDPRGSLDDLIAFLG